MAKRDAQPRQSLPVHSKRAPKTHVTRKYVHSLRGKFKGKDLLKALMAEKSKER